MSVPPAPRPGLYYPTMPATWWLRRPAYLRFMLREISSVFIALFLVVLLVQVYRAGQGPEAYGAFAASLASPGWIAFHVVALAFALYHTVTWLNLTAVVQVVRLGDRQVPPRMVAAGAFAVWAILTLGILSWFVLRS